MSAQAVLPQRHRERRAIGSRDVADQASELAGAPAGRWRKARLAWLSPGMPACAADVATLVREFAASRSRSRASRRAKICWRTLFPWLEQAVERGARYACSGCEAEGVEIGRIEVGLDDPQRFVAALRHLSRRIVAALLDEGIAQQVACHFCDEVGRRVDRPTVR